MYLPSSIGGADFLPNSIKVLRLVRYGCANRPFFHLSIMERRKEPYEQVIEQIGVYDPLPNEYNEKVVAINFDRLNHWIRNDVRFTVPVLKVLGLSGYFPIHPRTFEDAWRHRKLVNERIQKLEQTIATFEKEKVSSAK